VSIVAPHAGYAYSGQVAAYAYKLVRRQALWCRHHYWAEPLGIIPVQTELADAIAANSAVISNLAAAQIREYNAVEI
jgi:AmmeMemoRadiSam system protein B